MLKKIPLFWFLLSLFYLLLEVTFRADLLNLAATSVDQTQLSDLERVGRFISSLGFAIFVASFFRRKHDQYSSGFKYRRRLMLVSFFAGFFAFSWVQQASIDYIARNISDADKREILLSNLFRDVNYLSEVHKKGHASNWLDSSSKTTLALTPLMSFSNPRLENLASDFKSFSLNSEHAKATLNKDLSDPRVFHTHRLFFQAVADQYAFARHDSRDISGIKDHELQALHAYVTHRNSIDTFVKRVPKTYEPQPLTYEFYKKTMEYFLHSNFDSLYDGNNPENVRFKKIDEDLQKTTLRAFDDLTYLDDNKRYFIKGYLTGPDWNDDTISPENKANLKNLWFRANSSIIEASKNDSNVGLILDGFILDKAAVQNPTSRDYLKKFFGIYHKMEDACVAKPSKENQFHIVLNRRTGDTLDLRYSDKNFSVFFPLMFEHITKRTMREPHSIVCDYSYQRYIENHEKLYSYFKKTNYLLNRSAVVRITSQHESTIVDSFLFKAFLTDRLSDAYFSSSKEKEVFIAQFDNIDEYYSFISSMNYRTPESMRASIHQFKRALIRKKFVQRMNERGLDFSSAIPPIARSEVYGRMEVYEDPLFRAVMKRSMPYVFQSNGKLLVQETPSDYARMREFLKTYPEEKKALIRKWYAEETAKRLDAYVANPGKFSNSKTDITFGNDLAKGFVATGFVLLISNIMITLTMVNLFMMLFGQALNHHRTLVYALLLGLLTMPTLYIKNSYLFENLPSKSNPRIVKLTNYTANNQIIYDAIFPEIVQPNGIYELLKRLHAKEERLLFVF